MTLLFGKAFRRFLQTASTPWGMTSYQYYPDGPVRNVFRPNGTTTEYSYDRAARTESISHKRGTDTFSSYNYTYDGNGNRVMQIEYQNGVAETTTYGYDGADRLTHVEYPGEIVDYGYDGVGNRLSETKTTKANGTVLSAKTLAYNALNQLTAITDNANPQNDVTLNYDDNGNLVTKTTATGTTEYLYDTQNRLIGVSTNGNEVATYEYDAQGMRIGKQSLASTVSYVRDGLDVLTEYDAADTAIASYQYGNGLLSLHDATEGTAWYHEDTLGSPVVLTSSTGTQEASYKHEAFGLLKERTGLSVNSHLFTEKELDQETGLYYFGARYYDPELGRFITQDTYLGDPNTPGSLHRYLYAFGNPNRWVDRNGHYPNQSEALNLEGDFRGEESYLNWLRSLDLSTPSSTRVQLHELAFKQFSLHLKDDSPSYLYSKDFWWIDMRHFLNSAQGAYEYKMFVGEDESKLAAVRAAFVAPLIGGIAMEQNQSLAAAFHNDDVQQSSWYGKIIKKYVPVATEGSSAFTVEDLTSDYLGAYFGAYVLKSGDDVRWQLERFLRSINVGDVPKEEDDAWTVLPANQEAWNEQWRTDSVYGTMPRHKVHRLFGVPEFAKTEGETSKDVAEYFKALRRLDRETIFKNANMFREYLERIREQNEK